MIEEKCVSCYHVSRGASQGPKGVCIAEQSGRRVAASFEHADQISVSPEKSTRRCAAAWMCGSAIVWGHRSCQRKLVQREPRSSPRYPAELSQFPEGLLNEAFRKLFRRHAAGGSVRRDSFINLA
jgi:hypothetical protein